MIGTAGDCCVVSECQLEVRSRPSEPQRRNFAGRWTNLSVVHVVVILFTFCINFLRINMDGWTDKSLEIIIIIIISSNGSNSCMLFVVVVVVVAKTCLQFSSNLLNTLSQWISKSRVNSFNELINVLLECRLNLITGRLKVLQQIQLRYLPAQTIIEHDSFRNFCRFCRVSRFRKKFVMF